MLIHGGCHCGNISFDLRIEPDPLRIPARACGCSFCTKHGGVWTSNPAASLRVRVREPGAVSAYSFATKTADFQVCSHCGIVPLVTCDLEGNRYAVVSVNAFEGVDPALLDPSPANFDGESEAVRLARRQRNWIADVRFETA